MTLFFASGRTLFYLEHKVRVIIRLTIQEPLSGINLSLLYLEHEVMVVDYLEHKIIVIIRLTIQEP